MVAVNVVRGCGVRQPGGVYLVTALSERGRPLEAFVADPPIPVDPARMGLSPQGMTLAAVPGKTGTVVFDWVGAEHYPNAADYVEEVSLFGSSRRIPASFDFARLDAGSRHVLVHPRALVRDLGWLRENWIEDVVGPSFLERALARAGRGSCPFRRDHDDALGLAGAAPLPAGLFCASWWWQLLLPGTVRFSDDPDAFDDQCLRRMPVERRMPSFAYSGYTLPDRDVWVPDFAPGVILSLSISRIEVVRDPEDRTHEPALDRASRAGLPILEVDA